MNEAFADKVDALVKKAPASWLADVCDMFKGLTPTISKDLVIQQIPATNNADLTSMIGDIVGISVGHMSWEALGWVLDTAHRMYGNRLSTHDLEFLWAGPSPSIPIPARRIDQTLYDLITSAKCEILLVTFAAAKIERLTGELLKALNRNVHVRLILEFKNSSEDQLSYDALKAFPTDLTELAEVYHWPVEKRERNQSGRPGKLHAKIAIIDDTVLVSSANLTDDAFNRNLELGVMIRDQRFVATAKSHLAALVSNGILQKL